MSIKISDFHVGDDVILALLKRDQLKEPIKTTVAKVGKKYVTIDYGRPMRFAVPDWKPDSFYLVSVDEAYPYVLFRSSEDYARLDKRIAMIEQIQELKRKMHILLLDKLSDEQLDILLNSYQKIYDIEKEKRNG